MIDNLYMACREELQRADSGNVTVVGIMDRTSLEEDEGAVLRWLGLGVSQVHHRYLIPRLSLQVVYL
jgi:hypothetical protein